MSPDELEREDLIASLDVLAGLMVCFAAMDDRERLPPRSKPAPVRTPPGMVAPHWINAA